MQDSGISFFLKISKDIAKSSSFKPNEKIFFRHPHFLHFKENKPPGLNQRKAAYLSEDLNRIKAYHKIPINRPAVSICTFNLEQAVSRLTIICPNLTSVEKHWPFFDIQIDRSFDKKKKTEKKV